VCQTDFFDCSRYAFRLAGVLAGQHGARLIVLHVNQAAWPEVDYEEASAQLQPPEHDELLRVLQRFQVADPKVHVEHRVVVGDPAAEILRTTRDTACDLIIIGTHGRQGLGRLLLGSVAGEVMRKASCPVLTVKLPSPASQAHPENATEKAARSCRPVNHEGKGKAQ
jgi:nucleotide-binding universal stress UspA family protein